MKIIIFLFLLISCTTKKGSDKNLILSLITINPENPKPFFSYPGRYSDAIKKREVLTAILNLIEETKFSLKVYAYSFNHPEIISALKQAERRGVIIEIVGDSEQNYDLLKENGFSVQIWKQSGLHHIKVMLADNKTLFTGTGNFSNYGLTNDWNGYLQFEIENNNRKRMNEFLSETLNTTSLSTNGLKFIGSPENGYLSQDLILNEIESAKISIEYLIFDQYDPILTHALRQASERGVKVTGVYNSPVDPEGIYLTDSFYGVSSNIYKDGNEDIVETDSFAEGGLLHHKTMILDGKTLLSGSFNYSLSARDSNREILFSTENPILVSEFQKEFQRVRDASYILPKKFYFTYPELINLDSKNINGDTLCLPTNINYPVIEIGEGIWKTYLQYPKVLNTNCFSISSYSSISSGITHASKTDFLSLGGLWDQFRVFDRSSNLVFTYQSENLDSLFYSKKKIISKNPKYFTFTNSRVYFEMKENLDIAGKNIKVWFPGKEIRSAILEQTLAEEAAYTALIPSVSTERFYAAAFIELTDTIYFFCFQERTKSNRDSFQYLLGQIELVSAKYGFETSCVRNTD